MVMISLGTELQNIRNMRDCFKSLAKEFDSNGMGNALFDEILHGDKARRKFKVPMTRTTGIS